MPEAPISKSHVHPARRNGAADGSAVDRNRERPVATIPYAELAITSNFTFLTGASHPEELVERAAALGHTAAAIADTNTLAGVVRAHVAAKEVGIPLAIGARLIFTDAPDGFAVLVFPTDRASYGRLCRLLTRGRRRAPKGECHLAVHDLAEFAEGLIGVVDVPAVVGEEVMELMRGLREVFRGIAPPMERRLPAGRATAVRAGWKPAFQTDATLYLAAARQYGHDDQLRLEQLGALADLTGLPLVAVNNVIYHEPRRKPLQDVLTCIRHGCTIEQAGFRLTAHAERHLKASEEMLRLFETCSWGRQAVENAASVALRASRFSLDQLRYEYPHEVCPPELTPMEYLTQLTWRGAAKRFPEEEGGLPEKVRRQIEHELSLIDELNYAPYFLTCYDIVVYARSQGILCQGRGAAANSAVCYMLGITSVDPSRINLLFERFVSRERKEPPDIDIDFEHERREEVIQYIYGKYGRDRAALTAEVITYRGRSAIREVGKAMGLSLDCVDRLAKSMDWWEQGAVREDRLRELGLNPHEPRLRQAIALAGEIIGFPRHLSQHVGGFVLTRPLLEETVPIGNAAMDDRTMIEWDKDDIDAVGILKIDVLGLGMLTAISKAFAFVNQRRRDEETKRRSGGVERGDKEMCDGTGQDVQRSCGVEAGDGASQDDLPRDDGDAGHGAVRADESDAPGRSIDSFKHRRRIREREQAGFAQVPSHVTWITERVGDPVRTGCRSSDAEGVSEDCVDVGRGRPRSSGADPESEAQGLNEVTLTPSSNHFVSSSLRLSVSDPPLDLHTVPPEDPRVYDMLCNADTIGIFQIESRAQMQMLPRLRPRNFYDLVIEVAIVRPGPIQGDMVHPYLRRRNGEEAVSFPDEAVRHVLEKTLGVPLFQEQAMQLAIVAAGFTPDEADKLRRAIAAWKRRGNEIYRYGQKLMDGMKARGYPAEFAERCFEQIKGFSEYGFPESHAASFALLVYVSAWLKRHHPAAFAAALINSQPMGFYAPAQIVRDAREHGVTVREIDVNHSQWDCTLEEDHANDSAGCHCSTRYSAAQQCGHTETIQTVDNPASDLNADAPPSTWGLNGPAIRLGMRLIKGLKRTDAEAIAHTVAHHGPFQTIDDLWRATPTVGVSALKRLAQADAFQSMGLDRQRALWAVRQLRDEALPLFELPPRTSTPAEPVVHLPAVRPYTAVAHDYAHTGLSLKAHPVSFVRDQLDARRIIRNGELKDERAWPHGKRLSVAGLVLVRQRPGTASGIVFITIEDETGVANLIVRPKIYEKFRKALRHAVLLIVSGTIERQGQVVHIMVNHACDAEDTLARPAGRPERIVDGSRNFR